MKPSSIPQRSRMPMIMGAAQFVVQEAFEMILSSPLSTLSFTPSTTVTMSASFAGAESTTRSAPADKCADAFSRVRKRPVHSSTTSMSSLPHGNALGSFSAKAFTFLPPRMRCASSYPTSPGNTPCTESYLKRWESVALSARSFTATSSMSVRSCNKRAVTRPIRPNPLMATRVILEGGN